MFEIGEVLIFKEDNEKIEIKAIMNNGFKKLYGNFEQGFYYDDELMRISQTDIINKHINGGI